MHAVLIVVISLTSAHAIADPKVGEKKAQLCLLCHKPGNVMANVPLLEAQPAKYLVAATNAYKTGKRPDPAMQANVAKLSARDIADIAAYFSSRPMPAGTQAIDAAKSSAGQAKAAELKCASCHQADFSGADLVPRLAGQAAGYLKDQLEAFASGRRAHPAAAMPAAGSADIESISAYLAGLR